LDEAGRTPLHYAALNDNADAVAALLNARANVNVQDIEGFTPLHLAAQQGALQAARELLDRGAAVDAETVHGNTPLFVAVFNSRGRGAIIELLRRHGADPFHANRSGQTPVSLSRLIANFDVARFFAGVTNSPREGCGA
jgi:ankyrin repeat protein